jgi:hypothetical protein
MMRLSALSPDLFTASAAPLAKSSAAAITVSKSVTRRISPTPSLLRLDSSPYLARLAVHDMRIMEHE